MRQLRFNSIKAAFENRQFDALDSASLSSMETILDILSSASGEAAAIPKELKFDNKPSTVLGRELFEYKLVRLLNDRHLVAKEPKLWPGVVSKYNEFIDDIVVDYKKKMSVFRDEKLSLFQSIARSYVLDDRRCNRDLDRELWDLAKFPRSVPKYHFPRVNVPVPVKIDSDNKFMLKKAVGNHRSELNLLCYLINHEEFLDKVIGNYQRHHRQRVAPYEMLDALMRTQSLEGDKIFTVVVKRILYRVPELNNDFIKDKFLAHSQNVKLVAGHQSRVLHRLMSLNMYKDSLQSGLSIVDHTKPDLLAANFNQFFGLCFRADRMYTENWVFELMRFFQDHQFDESELRRQALTDFDDLLHRKQFKVQGVRSVFEESRRR